MSGLQGMARHFPGIASGQELKILRGVVDGHEVSGKAKIVAFGDNMINVEVKAKKGWLPMPTTTVQITPTDTGAYVKASAGAFFSDEGASSVVDARQGLLLLQNLERQSTTRIQQVAANQFVVSMTSARHSVELLLQAK